MRLTIKTLDQKTFHVDFDDSKTVWELKTHLYELPEIGVRPYQQQIIYAGRVLDNEAELKNYNIDERKFLVVMAKKPVVQIQEDDPKSPATANKKKSPSKEQPPQTSPSKSPSTSKQATQKPPQTSPTATTMHPIGVEPTQSAGASSVPVLVPTPIRRATPSDPVALAAATRPLSVDTNDPENLEMLDIEPTVQVNEALVRQIVTMGYTESEVRRALLASFNNADRAIEYLIEGIPEFNDVLPPESPAIGVPAPGQEGAESLSFLRDDPRFHQMRQMIQQRPELLSALLAKIGETNPALLAIIRQHQDEFLRMLNEGDSDDSAGQEMSDLGPGAQNLDLTDADRQAIQRLVDLGFERALVIQAYIACDKNEEQTADFLCRHMEDN